MHLDRERSDVKMSLTRSGRGVAVRDHASPIGISESGNHGDRRVLPHTFSRRDGVSSSGTV